MGRLLVYSLLLASVTSAYAGSAAQHNVVSASQQKGIAVAAIDSPDANFSSPLSQAITINPIQVGHAPTPAEKLTALANRAFATPSGSKTTSITASQPTPAVAKSLGSTNTHLPASHSLNKTMHEIMQSMHAAVEKSVVLPATHITAPIAHARATLPVSTQIAQSDKPLPVKRPLDKTMHELMQSVHAVIEKTVVQPASLPTVAAVKMLSPKSVMTVDARLPSTLSLEKTLHDALQSTHAVLEKSITTPTVVTATATTVNLPLLSEQVHSARMVVPASQAKVSQPVTVASQGPVSAVAVKAEITPVVAQKAEKTAPIKHFAKVDVTLPETASLDKTVRDIMQSTHAALLKSITKPAFVAVASKNNPPSLLDQMHTAYVTTVMQPAETHQSPVLKASVVTPVAAVHTGVAPAVKITTPKQFAKVDAHLPETASLDKIVRDIMQGAHTTVEKSIVKQVVHASSSQTEMPSLLDQVHSARVVSATPAVAVVKPVTVPVSQQKVEKVVPTRQFATVDANLPASILLDKSLHDAMQSTHVALAKSVAKPETFATVASMTDMPSLLEQVHAVHAAATTAAADKALSPQPVAHVAVPVFATKTAAALLPVVKVEKALPLRQFARVEASLPESISLEKSLHDAMQSSQAALDKAIAKPVAVVASKIDMPSLLEQVTAARVVAEVSHPETNKTGVTPLAPHVATPGVAATKPVFMPAPVIQAEKTQPKQFAKVEITQSEPISLDKALHDAMEPGHAALARALVKPGSLAATAPKTEMPSLLEHVHTARVAAAAPVMATTRLPIMTPMPQAAPRVVVMKPVVAAKPVEKIQPVLPVKQFAKVDANLPVSLSLDKSLQAAMQSTHSTIEKSIAKPLLATATPTRADMPSLLERVHTAHLVATAPAAGLYQVQLAPVPVSAPVAAALQPAPTAAPVVKVETITSPRQFAKLDAHLPAVISLEKSLRAAINEAMKAPDATLAKAIAKPAFVAEAELKIIKPPVVAAARVVPVAATAQIAVTKTPLTRLATPVIVSVLGTKTLPLPAPAVTVEKPAPATQFAKMAVKLPELFSLKQALRDTRVPTSQVLAESFAKPASIVVAGKSKMPALLVSPDSMPLGDKAQATNKALSNVILVASAPHSPEPVAAASPKLFASLVRFLHNTKSAFIADHKTPVSAAVMLAQNTAPSLASMESEVTHHARFKPLSSFASLPVIPVGHKLAIETPAQPMVMKPAPVEMTPAPGSLSARAIPIPKIVAETRAKSVLEAAMAQKYADHEQAMLTGLRVAMENSVHAPEMPVSKAIRGDLSASMLALANPPEDPTHHHTILEQITAAKTPLLGLRRPNTFNVAMFEKMTGEKGVYDAKTRIYKLMIPRDDLNIVVNGVRLTSAMGLTSWVAFKNEFDGAVMKGSLVLTEEQVNPVMFAAIENGLIVTDLHNHYLWETPKVVFMHIEAVGDAKKLAQSVSAVLAKMKDSGEGNGDFPLAMIDTANTTLSPNRIEKILGAKGAMIDGVYKLRIAKQAKGAAIPQLTPTLSAHTAVTFAGADDGAVMDGDIAMRDSQLQQVLLALHKAGISIVAIHQRTMNDDTRYVFLHYWGVGKTDELARGLRSALDASVPLG